MAQEGLYVPAGAPWLADFRAELLSFPTGRHDDEVDAIGLIWTVARSDGAPDEGEAEGANDVASVGRGSAGGELEDSVRGEARLIAQSRATSACPICVSHTEAWDSK